MAAILSRGRWVNQDLDLQKGKTFEGLRSKKVTKTAYLSTPFDQHCIETKHLHLHIKC